MTFRLALPIAWFAVSAAAVPPFTAPVPAEAPRGEVDRLVFAQLDRLGIPPAAPCTDAVFLRRVYLDVIGTPPNTVETREFLADASPEKRAALIERLLARDEFADYWAMKWSDLLRVKAEFPINLWPNAAQAYHRWIRAALRENLPMDQFARALLTASGSNFREPPVNFYRAMQSRDPAGIAQTVALTFMGERAERWPSNQLASLAAFFSQVGFKSTSEWKEEIVFNDPGSTNAALFLGAGRKATLPDGRIITLAPEADPRVVFADWLLAPDNPVFARCLANRAWAWLLGRGIVHEPDDFRPDNPPGNPELLACLERELRRSRYDLKQLFRLILNTRTYQFASIPASDHPAAAQHFASYPVRRLEAEVLIDAINQITGSSEKYSSAIPEPFTFIPDGTRSIALPDGSVTSSFLELFGRPPRDTGLEAERNLRITAAQRLHLLNSSHILRKLEQSPMVAAQSQSKRPPREVAGGLYLAILSRPPTAEELAVAERLASNARPRDFVLDLSWALVNNPEFLCRH